MPWRRSNLWNFYWEQLLRLSTSNNIIKSLRYKETEVQGTSIISFPSINQGICHGGGGCWPFCIRLFKHANRKYSAACVLFKCLIFALIRNCSLLILTKRQLLRYSGVRRHTNAYMDSLYVGHIPFQLGTLYVIHKANKWADIIMF